jgi:hypothetical protein
MPTQPSDTPIAPLGPEYWAAETSRDYVMKHIPELRTLLMHPVYRAATMLLKSRAFPEKSDIQRPLSNEELSRRYCWLAGFMEFDTELLRLLQVVPQSNDPVPTPWGHIEPTPH